MRLIDADALRADYLTKYDTDEFAFDNCYPWWQFSKAIADAPTVDAVPAVHGRWDKNWSGDNIVYCDRCYMPQDVPTPYCHSCGAKMDGDENAER